MRFESEGYRVDGGWPTREPRSCLDDCFTGSFVTIKPRHYTLMGDAAEASSKMWTREATKTVPKAVCDGFTRIKTG